MSTEERLPLFPLQTVLFPDSALPLHIFEERYKTLIREIRRSGGEFGVNFADGTVISAVGCTAVLHELVREYDDGRMDIVVRGKRRYLLREYNADTTPYLIGSVRFFAPATDAVDEDLARETTELYNLLMRKVYGDDRYAVGKAEGNRAVSFVIAQKAGLDLRMRQKILEAATENARLDMLRTYLNQVIPKIEKVEEVERVMRNDGYVSL